MCGYCYGHYYDTRPPSADDLRLGAIGAASRGDDTAFERLDRALDRMGVDPVTNQQNGSER